MVAIDPAATALAIRDIGRGSCGPGLAASGIAGALRSAAMATLPLALLLAPALASAASNKVRITNLGDVAFGAIGNLGTDAVRSQSVCLYADTNTNSYNITATGTGPAGAFELSSGVASMPYEVQWSSASGQSTGSQLAPNVPLAGQLSSGTQQTCSNGPATTASLILVLRSAALSSAAAGTYSGTLTLVVGAE